MNKSDLDKLIRSFDKLFQQAAQTYTEKHGTRISGTGYLGRNDGTNTCKDASFASARKMFYYTKQGGVAQPYSSAVLYEGSGIVYEDSAANKDKAVVLGYPPGDNRLHILRGADTEAYNATGGKTGLDIKIGA